MKTTLLLASLFTLATAASAATQSFDFKDPKGVNAARFSLDAPLEAISGTGNGITGSVDFDPANPSTISGQITLATASLTVPNGTMNEHLHSANWLDVSTYPEITFTATRVEQVTTDGATTKAHVTGELTVKGITKTITTPVTFTYLPGKLADRTNGQMQGDLLVLRTAFTINRNTFNIQAGEYTDKVAEEIQLSLALAGHHAK